MVNEYHDEGEYMNEIERRALGMCLDHIIYIRECVASLTTAIEAWVGHNEIASEKLIKTLSELENRADKTKYELLRHLSEATSLLRREDMMRVVLIADKIAENVESAGFHLTTILTWRPSSELAKDILKMIDGVIEIMDTLKEAVRMLTSNTEKVIAYIDKINNLERSIDLIHRKLLDKISKLEIDMRLLLRLRDFIDHIEAISDISEEVGDAILILAMSR